MKEALHAPIKSHWCDALTAPSLIKYKPLSQLICSVVRVIWPPQAYFPSDMNPPSRELVSLTIWGPVSDIAPESCMSVRAKQSGCQSRRYNHVLLCGSFGFASLASTEHAWAEHQRYRFVILLSRILEVNVKQSCHLRPLGSKLLPCQWP